MEKTRYKPLQKCPTGIRGLDEITEGGLPRGRPTLICGPAGCGKSSIATLYAVAAAERGVSDGDWVVVRSPPEPFPNEWERGGLIWLGVTLLKRNQMPSHTIGSGAPPASRPTAEEILAERLARGEIDSDDYRQRLSALRDAQP